MTSIEFVGWTLIHSVWEGGVIAALLAVTLRVARHASASARYVIAVAALGAVLSAPVATTMASREPVRTPVTGVSAIPPFVVIPATNAASAAPLAARTSSPRDFSNLRAIVSRVDGALPWIVAAWLAGLLALSVRLIGGVVRTRRLARDGVTSADVRVVEMAHAVAARLGIRAVIRILESTRVEVPMVVGWVAPVVLIPASLLTGLAPVQLEMLLAHELAHIRRFDTIVNLAQTMIETLLFYHPAVWWISSRIRDERENCCDDLAVAVTGNDRGMYGTTLLMLEESRGTAPMLATAAAGGSLLRRVRRLISGQPDQVDLGPRWLAAVITILAVFIATGTTNARASSGSAFVTNDTSHGSPAMPRKSILISTAALALASANVTAQPKPSFAGKWTLVACDLCADSSVTAARRSGGSLVQGWGAAATVLQDDKTLTVIRGTPTGEMRMLYPLTKSETRVFQTGANGKVVVKDSASGSVVARSSWNGDKLVIMTTGSDSAVSIKLATTVFLDASGDMIVETTVREARWNAAPGMHLTFVLDDQAADGKSSGFQLQQKLTLRYRRA